MADEFALLKNVFGVEDKPCEPAPPEKIDPMEEARAVARYGRSPLAAALPHVYFARDLIHQIAERYGIPSHLLEDRATHVSLDERLMKSAALRRLYPNQSTCGRCQTPWAACESHCTKYSDRTGCFPLCENCWQELGTPQRRMPFYIEMIEWWRTMGPFSEEEATAILDAVKAGG